MRAISRAIHSLRHLNKFCFSGGFAGPYNPFNYRDHLVPRHYPSNKMIYDTVRDQDKIVVPPVHNMRHINPIRQSGPLPAYSGTYTMEDIRKMFDQFSYNNDFHYCLVDVDEVMRRVPGITRKEVEKIQQLGLPPNEQIAYAYLVYTTGIDVFYKPNQVYLERQVVTNSKGQKVEVYTNTMAYEDLALVMFGFAPILFATDYHWELFLWGDSALKVTGDMDLGVPNTYFEYELEWSSEALMGVDQMNIPESIRPFATPRNPYSRRELWKSQQQLDLEKKMLDPNWTLPVQ